MRPAPFEYHDPRHVSEAVDLLSSLENARPLAGGQSLMPMMNFRYGQFDHLVDLNRIDDLSFIDVDGSSIRIGAMTRQVEMQEDTRLAESVPVALEALSHVGHIATRNRGTIGGSLSHLDPAAELLAVSALLDGVVHLQGKEGKRSVPIEDYVVGYMTPAAEEGELLTSVDWNPWQGDHGWSFREFARRHGDFALAGAAVLMALDEAGSIARAAVTVFGVGPAPVRLKTAETSMVGEIPTRQLFELAGEEAASLEAMQDAVVSGSYRRHLARVLTVRALEEASVRAKDEKK
ncbi:FAD binding domain-containing protein [Microbaculum marinum]|uniref:FAD binding domain-containing protein n=1 Tax=Microbaculum marinum TaxID=1764581 RepID=A0AAW9RKJ2_9HYPH